MAEENVMNQYLTFIIDDGLYALSVSHVREVLEFSSITRVPRMPEFMTGIINLRGSVVPVIDLRLKLGLSQTEKTVDTSIVVTEINLEDDLVVMGILTDSVEEVLDINTDEIEPPPRIGTKVKSEFIHGMGRVGERFLIILDIDKILEADELVYVADARSSTVSEEKEGAADPVE